jgi:hypothetical protein
MTAVFIIPIVLAILCGIGSFMVREPKKEAPSTVTRMPWLNEAIAYASVPLFSEEEKDEQQVS